MSEIDELVQRTVDTVTMIAGKAARFSTKLLIGAAIVCVGGFLLGVAALSGGIQQVWIVLGIVFGSIAIGGAFLARWRVGSVKRHVPELAAEVRTLVSEGKDSTRTVIETFAVDADGDGRAPLAGHAPEGLGRPPLAVLRGRDLGALFEHEHVHARLGELGLGRADDQGVLIASHGRPRARVGVEQVPLRVPVLVDDVASERTIGVSVKPGWITVQRTP